MTANRQKLDGLAVALLEHETLDQDAAYEAAGVTGLPAESTGRFVAAAQV